MFLTGAILFLIHYIMADTKLSFYIKEIEKMPQTAGG